MNKKNLPLYIALAVPVLMILLVAAFIYFPGVGKHPKYNFFYMSGNDVYYYGYGQGYQISGGHVIYNPPQPPPGQISSIQQVEPHFYVYDVTTSQSSEISFSQAQKYTIDSTNTSPDGYTVEQGNGGGGDFLFGGGGPSDYNSWFIKGHNRAVKLNLKLTGNTYSNFRFLGWIE
jgi:hypothetical protein